MKLTGPKGRVRFLSDMTSLAAETHRGGVQFSTEGQGRAVRARFVAVRPGGLLVRSRQACRPYQCRRRRRPLPIARPVVCLSAGAGRACTFVCDLAALEKGARRTHRDKGEAAVVARSCSSRPLADASWQPRRSVQNSALRNSSRPSLSTTISLSSFPSPRDPPRSRSWSSSRPRNGHSSTLCTSTYLGACARARRRSS